MKEKSVGVQLSFLRRDKGKTQEEVAEYLGIKQCTVSLLEGQDAPRIPTIKNYLRALDLECYLVVVDKEGKEVKIEL